MANDNVSKYHIEITPKELQGVKESNQKVINDVIVKILPMAEMLVGVYCRKFPYLADEVCSAGYYGLVKAVNNFHKRSHDNIVGSAKQGIKGHILNVLKESSQVKVPRWFQDEQRKLNPEWSMPETVSFDGEDFVEDGKPLRHGAIDMIGLYNYCIERMHLSPLESKVMFYIKIGNTNNSEIARRCFVSHTKINSVRKELMARLKNLRNNPEIVKAYEEL